MKQPVELDPNLYTKSGKLRKRKPKTKNVYFTEETQAAIIRFRSLTDQIERDILYKEKIEYAFFKLTQNIINTYRYYHTDGLSIEELQQEVICFLLEKLHLFNGDKGKAYSYFGTIAKRYLINRNTKSYKKLTEQYSIDSINIDTNATYSESFDIENYDLDYILNVFTSKVRSEMSILFSDPIEYCIAESIVILFEKIDKVEIFNKKAIFLYLRELNPEVSNVKINIVLKKLYIIYQKIYEEYSS